MIQIWVKIKAGAPLTEDEAELLQQFGVDQYVKVGIPHDGLELLHCIVDPAVIPDVLQFLVARGQEPEIARATNQEGIPVDGQPENIELYNSFFPELPRLGSDGNQVVNVVLDEAGNVIGEELAFVNTPEHKFWGWR